MAPFLGSTYAAAPASTAAYGCFSLVDRITT
jgi:hypothetical protein